MSADKEEALHEAIEFVRNDRMRGASELARRAALALSQAATGPTDSIERLQRIHQAARNFAAARPSMAAIANTAARIWYPASHHPSNPLAAMQALNTEARQLVITWNQAAVRIANHAAELLGETLYTFSRSGTVEWALRWLAIQGRLHAVIIGESHPGDEGRALAQSLVTHAVTFPPNRDIGPNRLQSFAEQGISVTLIADAACGVYLPEANAVVIGADSVRADGSVVNKIGSYPLAVMAREAGVPFYALCETLKIAAPSFPLTFEEMDTRELLPVPVAGITVHNPYFEAVPARLVSGVITETGVLDAAAIARYAQQAEDALQALMA